MDSLKVNEVCAAVLVAGVAFMLSTVISDGLVHPTRLKEPAIKIEGAPAEATGAAAPAPLAPIAPLLATADPKAGEADMTKLCAVCHTWNQGGPARVGPNLYGIVGDKHAHMAGFSYSDGLQKLPGNWTYDQLNEWLHNPRAVVPGTRMGFAGISSDKERADVIDYLHTLSPHPEPLPSPEAAAPAAAAGAAPEGAAGKPAAAAPAEQAAVPKPGGNGGTGMQGSAGAAGKAPGQATQTEQSSGSTQPQPAQGGTPAPSPGAQSK
ncbi:MAG: cytochrome c family protein [Acidisphaera sp.]|nr:cytochrome c family protein [Acidisphaera sp.]